MKYVKEFGIILIVSLVGELLNYFLPLPVPASIYGLALMFLCLMLGIITGNSCYLWSLDYQRSAAG